MFHNLTHCILVDSSTAMRTSQFVMSGVSGFNSKGAVVEWLEQLGYGAESRRIA